ncbi:unnamed protein product [Sympodiomycopsis kandeliae]
MPPRYVPGAPKPRVVPGSAAATKDKKKAKKGQTNIQPTNKTNQAISSSNAAPLSSAIGTINNNGTMPTSDYVPTSQLRAALNSLPKAHKLTFEEELTYDSASDKDPDKISPIEVEVCGVGAKDYEESYIWWITSAFHKDIIDKKPLIVGVSLSLQINGQVDAILLSTHRRLLIIRTRNLLEDRKYNRVGKTRYSEYIIKQDDPLNALLYNRLYVEGQRVHLAGFHGALQALHIHRATGLHSRIIDLSTDERGKFYEPAHIRIHKAKTFTEKAAAIAALTINDFQTNIPYSTTLNFDEYVSMAIESVSAFAFAKHHSRLILSEDRPLIDTARLSLRDLNLGSRVVAVFHSINMLQPELRKADFTDILPGDEKGLMEIENERYSTRLMPNSQQRLQIKMQDGSVVDALTLRAHGKMSEIVLTSADGREIPSTLSRNDIAEIVVAGREDADMAENQAVRFWFKVMRYRDTQDPKEMEEMQTALDPSGLFYPLFYGEPPVVKVGVNRDIRKFGPPSEHQRYSVIDLSKLDLSQRQAAYALAGPIRTHSERLTLIHGPPGTGKTTVIANFCKQWTQWLEDRARDEDSQVADKLKEMTKPFKAPAALKEKKNSNAKKGKSVQGRRNLEDRDEEDESSDSEDEGDIKVEDKINPEDIVPSVWCVCQSNAAVKNIAEGLKKAGVPFKIFVSDSFFVEWHEHIYTFLSSELILTSKLNTSVASVKSEMAGVSVFLSTVSGLSSYRLDQAGMFTLRPIYALLVDEASQIPLGAYPHLLARHSQTMARIAFFGDHKQLAPFGSDTIEGIESVFELRHLIDRAHMLKCCYRLPRALCKFVSQEVYDNLLTSGKTLSVDNNEPLTRSVRFIDVHIGRESRGENSFENVAEARCIATFIEQHMQEVDFKVLAPYTRQRDTIEKELKLQNLPWEGKVFTVDSFQGQESDVIIVSLVRDGLDIEGHTAGFLTNERRSNVLITRCKVAMYVFTSKRFLLGPQAKGRHTLIGGLGNVLADSGPPESEIEEDEPTASLSEYTTDLYDDLEFEKEEISDEDQPITRQKKLAQQEGTALIEIDDDDEDEEGDKPEAVDVKTTGWKSEKEVTLGLAALPPPRGGFEKPEPYKHVTELSALPLDLHGTKFDKSVDGIDNSTLRIAAMLNEQGGRNRGSKKRR